MKILLFLLSVSLFADSYTFLGKGFNGDYQLLEKQLSHIKYTLPFFPIGYGMLLEKNDKGFIPLSKDKLLTLDKNNDSLLKAEELESVVEWVDYNKNLKNDFGEIAKVTEVNLNCKNEQMNLIHLNLCKNDSFLEMSSTKDFSLSTWDEWMVEIRKNYMQLIQVNISYDKSYMHGYILTDNHSIESKYIKILIKDGKLKLDNCIASSQSAYLHDLVIDCPDEKITAQVVKKTYPVLSSGSAQIKSKTQLLNRSISLTPDLVVAKIYQQIPK